MDYAHDADGLRASRRDAEPATVLFVGDVDAALVQSLLDAGATVVIAPTMDAARAWDVTSRDATPEASPGSMGGLYINDGFHRAEWNGVPLPLTEQEFRLVAALARSGGKAISFAELAEAVWAREDFGFYEPLRSAVKRLRRKFHGIGVTLEIIAVRGFGFRIGSNDASTILSRPTADPEAARS